MVLRGNYMSKHELSQEIATIKELIAEEARDIVELTDELIDLEEHARHERPVPHARCYRIKVDAMYHEVKTPMITGEAIPKLAGRGGLLVFDVIQHFRGGKVEIIAPDAEANLRTPGVEKFTTAPKMVQITVDSRSVEVQAGTYIVGAFKTI